MSEFAPFCLTITNAYLFYCCNFLTIKDMKCKTQKCIKTHFKIYILFTQTDFPDAPPCASRGGGGGGGGQHFRPHSSFPQTFVLQQLLNLQFKLWIKITKLSYCVKNKLLTHLMNLRLFFKNIEVCK